MRISKLLFLSVALLYSEPRKVLFTGNSVMQGVTLRFETVLEGSGDSSNPFWGKGHGGGFRQTGAVEHRYLWDEATHSYFGYDLRVEARGASGTCRVAISPLSMQLDVLIEWPRQPVPGEYSGYKLLSLPANPDAQIVRTGDTIAVDLLTSPDGKQKVVDYINVSCRPDTYKWIPTVSGGVPPDPTARDFKAEDLQLRLVRPEVWVNGKELESTGLAGEATGNVLWIAIPGKGRFELSLVPYPNFAKGGTLQGSVILFQYAGDSYEVRFSEPAFRSARQPWNLYVHLDPLYRNAENATFGASGRHTTR
jgi:hypothetical protein